MMEIMHQHQQIKQQMHQHGHSTHSYYWSTAFQWYWLNTFQWYLVSKHLQTYQTFNGSYQTLNGSYQTFQYLIIWIYKFPWYLMNISWNKNFNYGRTRKELIQSSHHWEPNTIIGFDAVIGCVVTKNTFKSRISTKKYW